MKISNFYPQICFLWLLYCCQRPYKDQNVFSSSWLLYLWLMIIVLITRIIGIPRLFRCCTLLFISSNGVVNLDQLLVAWYCISQPANGCSSYTHISYHANCNFLVSSVPFSIPGIRMCASGWGHLVLSTKKVPSKCPLPHKWDISSSMVLTEKQFNSLLWSKLISEKIDKLHNYKKASA